MGVTDTTAGVGSRKKVPDKWQRLQAWSNLGSYAAFKKSAHV
jgi:hypothetical protein